MGMGARYIPNGSSKTIERFMKLVRLVAFNNQVSIHRIAAELECSTKTAYRLVVNLARHFHVQLIDTRVSRNTATLELRETVKEG